MINLIIENIINIIKNDQFNSEVLVIFFIDFVCFYILTYLMLKSCFYSCENSQKILFIGLSI